MTPFNIFIKIQRPDISVAGHLLKEPMEGTMEDIQGAFDEMQELLAKAAVNHFVLHNADDRSATGSNEVLICKAFYSAESALVTMRIEKF
jgi:hypothetical protein